jgi:hypothetical protein
MPGMIPMEAADLGSANIDTVMINDREINGGNVFNVTAYS